MVGPLSALRQLSAAPHDRVLIGRMLPIATILALPYVFFNAFSQMAWFDDEGTLLIGFRSWLDGHRMYDEIYSLYGPLYNLFYGAIYTVLHVPLTHSTGRLIAAGFLLSITAGCATFCFRVTKSLSVALLAYVLVLLWLTPILHSPGHPEEMCLLMMAGILLLTCSVGPTANRAALAGIGALLAGLTLVKINFGAYVGAGLLLVLLRATAPTVLVRSAAAIVAIALVALPLGVQAVLFGFAWVRLYCLFASLSIGSAVLVLLTSSRQQVLQIADWWALAFAGAIAAMTIVGATIVVGSSPSAILNAVLLQNAHFIQNWFIRFDVGGSGMLAVAVSASAAVFYGLSGSVPALRPYRDWGVLLLKGGFVLMGVAQFASPDVLFRALVPFCWLLMIVPAGAPDQCILPRRAAALIGASLSLYPFPVAGHQISIASLIAIMAIPVLANDVWTILLVRWPAAFYQRNPSNAVAMAVAIVIGSVATLRSAAMYRAGVPLGLPGTTLVRVEPKQADDLRWVTAQLSSCKASYSLPGLPSFNLWTGQGLLTPININGILNFIGLDQQQRIVDVLNKQPGLCILYFPKLIRFLDRGQIAADPPLLHYIQSEFSPAAERDGYVILKARQGP